MVDFTKQEAYWKKQKIESWKWQENRYQTSGMVWGTFPGPTVEYACDEYGIRSLKNILIVGCGYGRECMFFADQGFDVIGIDFSKEGIRIANNWLEGDPKHNVKFLHADALDLPFGEESMNAVFTHKVLHQFNQEDRNRMISEIYRVLQPGGLLVLSDLSTNDPGFGKGEEIEKDTFIRPNKQYRPIHYLSSDHLEIFENFRILDVHEFNEWEAHPGENKKHQHLFIRITCEKPSDA